MANYQHPGLYIQEVPGTRSIQGASTSVPAFVGVTETGPVGQPSLITSWNAYQQSFGKLAWYAMVSWSVHAFFNEGGGACYVVRAADNADAKAAMAEAPLTVSAVTPGTWGNALSIMVGNDGASDPGLACATPAFEVSVLVDQAALTGSADAPVTMPNLLLKHFVEQNRLEALSIKGRFYYVLERFSGFTGDDMASAAGQLSQLGQRINARSMFVRVPANRQASEAARPANGGPAPLAGGSEPNYDLGAATAMLDRVQGVSMLSVPDTVTASDQGRPSMARQATLTNLGLNFCEAQRDLFYVIDPPAGLDVQGMLSFKTGRGAPPQGNPNALQSAFGAIYYPWVYIYNPVAGFNVPVPPSGPVLGRYVHTDTNAGVWKSPAGVHDGALRTVVALAQALSDADQDQLNPQGVNALRNLPGYGNLIWGARTLALGTEWTYISVRRLFIHVEQSLRQSLQWAVFEPNDQQLRAAVSRDISAFLATLWQQGALFGATPQEAFFVTCDASNNPPEARALGQLCIDIGMAPVFPGEFVILRLTQKTASPDADASSAGAG